MQRLKLAVILMETNNLTMQVITIAKKHYFHVHHEFMTISLSLHI